MALFAVQALGARGIEVVGAVPFHDVIWSVVAFVGTVRVGTVLLACHVLMLRIGTGIPRTMSG